METENMIMTEEIVEEAAKRFNIGNGAVGFIAGCAVTVAGQMAYKHVVKPVGTKLVAKIKKKATKDTEEVDVDIKPEDIL